MIVDTIMILMFLISQMLSLFPIMLMQYCSKGLIKELLERIII